MKIAIRAGHNFQAKGASALLCETTEARALLAPIVKYLKALGHNVLDVTPGNLSTSADLAHGVNKANSWGAELFVSVHFNKAYSSYNGAIGSEVCVMNSHPAAQRVVDALGKLGFKNRGQKKRVELYELKNTTMKAMIIETCFIEATEDVSLYKKLGTDKIGRHIAEAISNKKLDFVEDHNPGGGSVVQKHLYRVRKTWADAASQKGAYSVKSSAIEECNKYVGYSVFDEAGKAIYTNEPPKKPVENIVLELQKECNRQGFKDKNGKKLSEDGILGEMTLSALPVLKYGAKGNITKLLQKALVKKGHSISTDGVFGNGTQKAVKDVQKKNKLTVDGIVGKNTWSKVL